MSEDTLPMEVMWPERVGGCTADSDRGLIGVFVVESDTDVLRLAFTPAEARQVAAFWLNLSDRLDRLEKWRG